MTSPATSGTIDNTLYLPDGRRLGYLEYGDPNGFAVFFCHGMPGSRFQCPRDEAFAAAQGVRVIAPERPGFGLSDPKARHSLAEYAEDVATLADRLGIERFAVAGFSSGGAYALACAQVLPQRVTRLGLIGSPAPFDVPENWEGLGPIRDFMTLARTDPAAFVQAMAAISTPETLFDALAQCTSPQDQALLARAALRETFLQDGRETLRRGSDAAIADFLLMARAWDTDPAEVRVKTVVWQGEMDINVSPAMGRYLARTIPDCTAHFLPDEGHLLLFAHWRAILASLVE